MDPSPKRPPRSRRVFLGLAGASVAAIACAFAYEPLLVDDPRRPVPIGPRSRFHTIYSDPAARARFVAFLEHVFHVVPPSTLDAVIADACRTHGDDRAIYAAIQRRLPREVPPFATARYALPALSRQKREIARETARLVGDRRVDRYVEIGTPGRYVAALDEAIGLGD